MEPIFIVTCVCLIVEIIKKVGYGTISKIGYSILYGNQNVDALKKEMVVLEKELRGTSAMDEFAKWARIRRELDGVTKKHQDLKSDESMKKLTVQLKVTSFLWIITTISHVCCSLYFRSDAMFYVPKMLGPLDGYLSLPFAPDNSVSVVVWYYCLKQTTGIVLNTLEALALKK